MKKFSLILLVTGACVLFAGCGRKEPVQRETRTTEYSTEQSTELAEVNDETQETTWTENIKTEKASENQLRILVAYFTRADNIQINPDIDAVSSASINIDGSSYKGNLAIMADYIEEAAGGDKFSILTTEYYPTGYRDTTNVAKEEQNNDARPELSNHVENMEDYPNWWGDIFKTAVGNF